MHGGERRTLGGGGHVKALAKKSGVEAKLMAADVKLGRLIRAVVTKVGKQRAQRNANTAFEALVRAITHQQMVDPAAGAVYARLLALGADALTPSDVLAASPAALRGAGLSSSKAHSVWCLAAWFERQPEVADHLHRMSNDNIISALTSVPGVGLWTANVFLIFFLQRPDVVPAGDLGIRKGVQLAYGLDEVASAELVLEKSKRWAPHRSLASVYLWTAVKLKLTAEDLRAPRLSA